MPASQAEMRADWARGPHRTGTGLARLKNGALLQVASGHFDVLLTVDRNIAFQQNLQGLRIAVVAMVAKSNRFRDLRPMMAQVRLALPKAKRGEVLRVGG